LKGNSRNGLERGHYAMALGETVDDKDLRNLLAQEARMEFERFAAASGKRLEEIVDPEDLPTPSTAREWFGMGWWLHEHLGRYDQAEAAYRQAITLDPKYAFSSNNLGLLLQDHLARYEEAETTYHQVIALDSNYAFPWNNLGNLLQNHLARYEEAEAAYRQAIALDSNYALPWNNLGLLLQDHLGRYDEAETAYRRALDLGLTSDIPQFNLCLLSYKQPERYAEAESLFETLVDRLPSRSAGLLRAFRALALDNFGETIQALTVALAENSESLFTTNHIFLRVLRLAAERGYGEKILAWLDEQGYADHYWPLRVAFDAYLHGEAKLMDVNPEVRGAAKRIYDWLDSVRRAQATKSEESGKSRSRPKHQGSVRRSR
jgi:tetratricopeptide (TPR) repeat protein